MRKKLLLIVAFASVCFSLHAADSLLQLLSHQNTTPYCPKTRIQPSRELSDMLHREASTLNTAVINKVMSVLKCANEYNVEHNNILTIIF